MTFEKEKVIAKAQYEEVRDILRLNPIDPTHTAEDVAMILVALLPEIRIERKQDDEEVGFEGSFVSFLHKDISGTVVKCLGEWQLCNAIYYGEEDISFEFDCEEYVKYTWGKAKEMLDNNPLLSRQDYTDVINTLVHTPYFIESSNNHDSDEYYSTTTLLFDLIYITICETANGWEVSSTVTYNPDFEEPITLTLT